MYASVCTKYGGPEVLKIIDVPTPIPNEDEIQVKVTAAIVSPTDSNFRSGKPVIARLFSGLLKPKKAIHGEMFQGTVTQVGSNVTTFHVGDIVYGTAGMRLGAYAEYLCVNTKEAVKTVPDDINPTHALTLLDGGITALPFLIERGNIKKTDDVLVIGASGAVGSMAVMIAKEYGKYVTGVCSTTNVTAVKSLGADYVIDYKKIDYTKEQTKYNIVFDAVGKSSYGACKSILKDNGIYLTTVPTPGTLLSLIGKENTTKKRQGFMAAGLRKPNIKLQDLSILEELIRQNKLTPLIGKTYPLQDLGKAQAYVETGHKVGNVIVTI